MRNTILLFLLCSLSLFGMSYKQFKNHTLKHSKILKRQILSSKVTQEENTILLRTTNPLLTFETSRFDDRRGKHSFGYAVTLSQNIRTGSYMNGLKEKSYASTLLTHAFSTQGRAGYLKTLESLYTQYVYQHKMLSLLQQEYKLSNKVTHMVKERYQSGSENRVSYLQARTETSILKTQMYTTKQQQNILYYQLLAISGFRKNVSLEKRFIYTVSSKTKNSSKLSPKQQIVQAKEKLYKSDYTLNQNSFTNYDLYTSIEKEPEQSIIRMGVNIPLSLYNDRSEERMLAKLKMQQMQLDKEQLSLTIRSQKKMIKATIKELSNQYYALKTLQQEQTELTHLLQEGYKIAKGSLFQLMTTKNKLIQTKKSLLQTVKMINNQKIELHFLQGKYND